MKSLPKEPLIIGENETSIRSEVDHLYSRDDDLEDSEFSRLQNHVDKVCFGWVDETDPECQNHCDIAGACAEQRTHQLKEIARFLEKEDASVITLHEMESRMKGISKVRDNTKKSLDAGDLDEIWK